MILISLYFLGIVAESITGAIAAGKHKMDVFGVLMISSVTAIGGGSLRDMILGHYPLGWVKHPIYIITVLVASFLTIIFIPFIKSIYKIFIYLDSLGLVVFSIIGTKVAMDMKLSLIVMVISAVITGVFGGVIRDLFCGKVPLVFQHELYASVAVISSLTYIISTYFFNDESAMIITLISGFVVRLLALKYKLGLPYFKVD